MPAVAGIPDAIGIPRVMSPFRLPLKVTGITILVALVLGIAGVSWLYQRDLSDRRKMERASQLGTGLGVVACLVIAPFWLAAAGRVGAARRAEREARKRKKGA